MKYFAFAAMLVLVSGVVANPVPQGSPAEFICAGPYVQALSQSVASAHFKETINLDIAKPEELCALSDSGGYYSCDEVAVVPYICRSIVKSTVINVYRRRLFRLIEIAKNGLILDPRLAYQNAAGPPSVPICCLGPLIAGDTYQFGSCFHHNLVKRYLRTMKAFFIAASLTIFSSVLASPQGSPAQFICAGPDNIKCPLSVPNCCIGPLISGEDQFGHCQPRGTACPL
ncbi:hypothetical protein D9613_006579 [Agrocybe pediades]|uniref:Hydrophobin n=1 Tax=Agrocybe pediades TaxID=84607 RepID=A0A8H4VJT5_9AGAR|nr:hypothetical protein D9613_006579 [Agrocybe pediades]